MKVDKFVSENKELIVALAVLFVALFLLFGKMNVLNFQKSENTPKAKIIEVVNDCKDCFDVNALYDSLTKENSFEVKNMVKYDYNSKEGKEAIEKYGLSSVPSLIVVSKDIEELGLNSEVFTFNKNYAIFNSAVPYLDLDSGEIKGLVNITEVVNATCFDCSSLSNVKDQFESLGIKINNYKVSDISFSEGQNLVQENDLTLVPALLISKNIDEYKSLFSKLKDYFIEKENYYVLNFPAYPAYDINSGEVKGLVNATYVVNNSCENCFGVDLYKKQFMGMGVVFQNESTLDISTDEGKLVLDKYNITSIPALVLSPGISDYNYLIPFFNQIGTFEKGGEFVFRDLDGFGKEYQKINETKN